MPKRKRIESGYEPDNETDNESYVGINQSLLQHKNYMKNIKIM